MRRAGWAAGGKDGWAQLQEGCDGIVEAAAKAGAARRIDLARMAADETGMGVFEDKVIKNMFATEYVYDNIRDVKTVGLVRDCPETGLMEFAEPLGVVLGITPVTNPTSTALFKCLICLKTRNAIVVSAARNALRCSIEAANTIYQAALRAGAPDHVIQWVEEPSREMTHALMTHPDMSLILATGGMGLVQAAYRSGTPAIGVGPGNVPVYIDKNADIPAAVNDILMSKTFDNGMICASEQAVVVHKDPECRPVDRELAVDPWRDRRPVQPHSPLADARVRRGRPEYYHGQCDGFAPHQFKESDKANG